MKGFVVGAGIAVAVYALLFALDGVAKVVDSMCGGCLPVPAMIGLLALAVMVKRKAE